MQKRLNKMSVKLSHFEKKVAQDEQALSRDARWLKKASKRDACDVMVSQ